MDLKKLRKLCLLGKKKFTTESQVRDLLTQVCISMAETSAKRPASSPVRQHAIESSSWRLRYVDDLMAALACLCFAHSYRWIYQGYSGPSRGVIWFIAGHPHDIEVAKILLPYLRAESYKAYYRVQGIPLGRRDRTVYREKIQEGFAARIWKHSQYLIDKWDNEKSPSYLDVRLYKKKAVIVDWMYDNKIMPIHRLSRRQKGLPYKRARYLWCNTDRCMTYRKYVTRGFM